MRCDDVGGYRTGAQGHRPRERDKIFLRTVIRITARAEGLCLLLASGGSEVNGACHGKTTVALVALD